MRKHLSTFLVLSIIASALVAVVPTQQASAAALTVSWPQHSADTGITQVVAHGEDDLTLLSCNWTSFADYSDDVFLDLKGDQVTDSLPMSSGFGCDSRNSSIVGPDGTVYGNYYDAATETPYFAAANNGRIKWKTDMTSASQCTNWPYPYNMDVSSVSVGADGNVYAIISSYFSCARYFVGYNSSTGAQLFKKYLGNYAASPGNYGVRPQVWTYDSKIVVIDPRGLLHEYDYEGVEDTGAQYQFPSVWGRAYANADGRVFVASEKTGSGWSCTPGRIYYHDDNGDDGDMARFDCNDAMDFQVGHNGTLVALDGLTSIYVIDVENGTYTSSYADVPTGFNAAYWASPHVGSYFVDEDGNVVITRVLAGVSPAYKVAVSVDYVEASTGITTNLYLKEGTHTTTSGVSDTPDTWGADITGDSVYVPVSYSYQTTSPYARNFWVEKVDVGAAGFGSPVKQVMGFADPPDLVEYVAMGDSFSSGEGNPDFTDWTDIDDTNECHRSKEDAYPLLLASDSGLDLHLADFVACSGATTNDVLGIDEIEDKPFGKWNEPAQMNMVSEDADVITITLGGNDVGFSAYATACVTGICSKGTSAYTTIVGKINNDLPDNLDEVYAAIAGRISETTQVYVVGYPQIAPDPMPTGMSSQCTPLSDGGGYFSGVEDMDGTAVYDVIDRLNTKIETAVNAVSSAQFHYIDPNGTGSPFIGHDWCSEEPYFETFLAYNELEYTFHPTPDGQIAYKEVIEAYIDNQ